MPDAFPKPRSGNTGVNSSAVQESWVGIDWITAFCGKDWSDNIWPDFDTLDALASDQLGAREEAWAKQGFLGTKHGCVAAGERSDGTLREVTGGTANRYCEMVADSYHLLRPSRLDIAFTFRLRAHRRALASSYYATGSSSRGGRCRPRGRSLYTSTEGGETLYIGSATSDTRIRLYDKDAEQKGKEPYERCWRFELQLRRGAAQTVWAAYHNSQDRSRTLRGFCKAQCEREAILGFIDWDSDGIKLAAPERPAPELERRLEWLSKQVAPTVRDLTAQGYLPAVLRALGFDDIDDIV